ncbi:hypothetical protein Lesp02_20000 [Lentzea sp. NBRC 105346]|uniref:nucleotidyltransferase domain-containing protein n=1 Tax=Lentzea sp. NBRC 105346 TaxID=3032205 RepID=UPI0024A5803C|nr:nucleotidyltransferase domain-containing protein [Lentzea sp. NBRC 105346]GLZ29810.1 hypothetical protein Lesp02_20000 [Lentzea sp. NBRC 105346]
MLTESVRSWAPDDVGFTDAQIEAARVVVTEQLADVELAFLAGSLAVGLGHGTSDIDLYVVGPDLPAAEVVHEHRGIPVHVNPLSAAKVRELVAIADVYRTTGADRSQAAIHVKTLNSLVRLAGGQRLLVSPAWAEELARLDANVVRQILMVRNGNVASAYAEDVSGALATGDLLTAVSASALALESACEAALAASGDLYVGPKFLFRRLARTRELGAWCDLVFWLNNQNVPRNKVGWLTAQRLNAAAVLLAWCATDGWEGLPGTLPAPPGEWPPYAPGPLRNVYFTPLRFADGWALIGPEDGFEVSECVVRLWGGLDGRPLAEVVNSVPDIGLEEAADAVAQLVRFGAVRPAQPAAQGKLFIRRAPQFSVHPKAAVGGAA